MILLTLTAFLARCGTGRPLLLEGDFDWKEMAMSPKDMDFLQNKHMAAKDIALCFAIDAQFGDSASTLVGVL